VAKKADSPAQGNDRENSDASRRDQDDRERRCVGTEMSQESDALIGAAARARNESIVFDFPEPFGPMIAEYLSQTGGSLHTSNRPGRTKQT